MKEWLELLIHYKLKEIHVYDTVTIVHTTISQTYEIIILLKNEVLTDPSDNESYFTGKYITFSVAPEMLHDIKELNKLLDKMYEAVKESTANNE